MRDGFFKPVMLVIGKIATVSLPVSNCHFFSVCHREANPCRSITAAMIVLPFPPLERRTCASHQHPLCLTMCMTPTCMTMCMTPTVHDNVHDTH
jgi:hypothetical protein